MSNHNDATTPEKASPANRGVGCTSWDDDMLLNPFGGAYDIGCQQGQEAGQQAGYEEGIQLGHLNGIDIGLEIGFYHGILEILQREFEIGTTTDDVVVVVVDDNTYHSLLKADSSRPKLNRARILKTMHDLSIMLEEFPTNPNQLLQSELSSPSNVAVTKEVHQDADTEITVEHLQQYGDVDDSDVHLEETERHDTVQYKLQLIRSRFKLLTVQLGMPHFSLTQILTDEHIVASSSSSTTRPATTTPTTATISELGNTDW